MIRAVIIHAPSGNVGSALSGRKGEKDVGPGSAIAGGNIVAAAQAVIKFDQKLVGCVALLRRRNEISGGIVHNTRNAGGAPESFVIQKEKSLVLQNGSAKGSTELVQPKRRFGEAIVIEIVARVQCIVS